MPGPGGFPGLPTPGAWPAGVPNPFGLPSPQQIGQTIGQWFSNPYGTTGTQGNQNPYGGIDPYGTQVSGGLNQWGLPKWDPKTYGVNTGGSSGDTSLGQSGGFAPLSQMGQRGGSPADPVTLQQPRRQQNTPVDSPLELIRRPLILPPRPPPITGGHMGGGTWGTGILGPQWLYHQGGGPNAPWQHVQPGSSVYGKGG